MFFIVIRVRRRMQTGLLNVEKETKSTEPSTFGHVIFQNGAPEKVISISLEL